MTIAFRIPRRRSALFRCSALAWAVVFLLSGTRDAVAQVECAHHSGVAAEHGAAGALHGTSHAGHAAEHGDSDPDPEVPGHPCTCVGPCQAAAAAALPTPGWTAVAPAVVSRTAPPVFRGGTLLPARAPFVLPYPNAPPLRG
jgi:hypothetical protein